jgi:hypothetical protein
LGEREGKAAGILNGELNVKTGDPGRGALGGAKAAEGAAKTFVVAVAMSDTTEFAVPQQTKWPDLLTAI